MDKYTFTDQERAFLVGHMDLIDRLSAQIKGAMDMLIAQQQLQGDYELAPDRSGLIRKKAHDNA